MSKLLIGKKLETVRLCSFIACRTWVLSVSKFF